MTKNEFLQRFQLNALATRQRTSAPLKQHHKLVEAAVLVPLIERNKQLMVLLTKRAQHLKHHPGQISFPGGKVEKFDSNITQAALRETKEEIGIDGDDLHVLGQLHPYHTITGFRITPIVAFVKSNSSTSIDHNEVDEIFYVPISHFLNTKKHISLEVVHSTIRQKVRFMPYKQYNIWGATATIINDLVNLIEPTQD